MRKKTWRRDIAFYGFRHEAQLRYTDIDTERHINNVALLTMHAEARSRFHLSLFGRERWLAMTAMLRAATIETDFLQVTHYPESVQSGVSLVALGTDDYTLATALFQDGVCMGVQECRVGAWKEGCRIALPAAVRDRLTAYGIAEEPAC